MGSTIDLYEVIVHETERDDPEPAFFYHSDHLGSAAYLTNDAGQVTQTLNYLPYGEPYINQRLSGYNERFTFTGKERDEETGFSYFGARYMDHELMTMWLSIDPMSDKYPSLSPYNYCAWNPIGAIDPNGMDSIKTPNGMANAGTGYKATPNGLFLYGDGLQPKRWNPSLEVGGVVGLQGGYENYTPYESVSSSFASFNPQPIAVEGLTPSHDYPAIIISNIVSGLFNGCGAGSWLGENSAWDGQGLIYANKPGFGKGLSWRNGIVMKNTQLGRAATALNPKGFPLLSVGFTAIDVGSNIVNYGFESKQTYKSIGGGVGGIVAGSIVVLSITGPVGIAIGIGIGIVGSIGGEYIGGEIYDWIH